MVAHQRCGDLVRARDVLAQMQAKGFDAAQLAVYEQELNEPTPEAVQALVQLIDSGNRTSAEIAARMMVQDYPSSAAAIECLARVMEMGVEAVMEVKSVAFKRNWPLLKRPRTPTPGRWLKR